MTPIRVVIVDDHPAFRAGLAGMLSTVEGLLVAGQAADGEEALERVRDVAPDVVLMDLHMPRMSGLEATEKISAESGAPAVVALTMVEDDETVVAAMRAGASGYLLKGADKDDVVRAIHAAAAGELIFGRGVAGGVRQFLAPSVPPPIQRPFPELTDREVEVLDLLARGLRNTDIAAALYVSQKTVRNHVSNIFTKLDVDRSQAIVLAREKGLGR